MYTASYVICGSFIGCTECQLHVVWIWYLVVPIFLENSLTQLSDGLANKAHLESDFSGLEICLWAKPMAATADDI